MIGEVLLAVCASIQVEALELGPSSVVGIELPAGVVSPLAVLDVRVTAIGYSAAQDLVYGVDADGRVIAFDRRGARVPLPVRRSDLLRGATAGVVVGDRLVVRSGRLLLAVDINPTSPDYLLVVDETWLPTTALTINDFDLNPVDGLLYGVVVDARGAGRVVRVDPATGSVRPVDGTGALPPGMTSYGSVVLGPDGALYATANRDASGGLSTRFKVALDGTGTVVELGTRVAFSTLDASGCLVVRNPPRPQPQPKPQPQPQPAQPQPAQPRPAQPQAPQQPAPQPPVAQAPAVPPAPVPSPGPAPSSAPMAEPAPEQELVEGQPAVRDPRRRTEEVEAAGLNPLLHTVDDQRRWGLVALLLVLGGAAAARQVGSRRTR
ncbi:hypothetical protein [Actinosynnema mirum]|uniref:Uncharacterized protein n=1 Tax=Actinosynnema mirum (strain ATCC 29888 / DSM 43827 / JCM 3225 / NBRC 14064 / NCIMB 13271 / NRRL B-12336 / IMRU 3971 / 101) TaxID=446462 RepID=C6WBQ0_ACTMD|nr:hypothetical protein [Actinosynnema mirum]ACU35618.1 hypothetical protein Amir_1669 [Actinosynnema mirum DSM 43827]